MAILYFYNLDYYCTAMTNELIQAQFGPRAAQYVRSPVHSHGESLDVMMAMLQSYSIRFALDIATGGGHTALALSRCAKWVVASDITIEMLHAARHWAVEKTNTNVHFCQHDAGLIPFPDGTFDVVTCRLAPHHFPDVRVFLTECARVVRYGGCVAIIDNLSPPVPSAARFINAFERLRDRSHQRQLSLSEWQAWLNVIGLSVEHLQEFRKPMDFIGYCDRMGVPSQVRTRLQVMLQQAPAAVREVLNPRDVDGYSVFDLHELLILCRRCKR
jgi:SAM-dependent methyltransferase